MASWKRRENHPFISSLFCQKQALAAFTWWLFIFSYLFYSCVSLFNVSQIEISYLNAAVTAAPKTLKNLIVKTLPRQTLERFLPPEGIQKPCSKTDKINFGPSYSWVATRENFCVLWKSSSILNFRHMLLCKH